MTEWILRNGAATPALWEGSVGLWVNILLYAREGFSLVRRIFSEANDIEPDKLFRPSLRALDELRVLAIFAPFLGTDISAQVEPTITAVDASSRVAAVVSATVDKEVARELWRHRSRRATSRGALQSKPPEELAAAAGGPEERAIAAAVGDLVDDDDEVSDCAPTWVAELADGLAWTCDVQFRVS